MDKKTTPPSKFSNSQLMDNQRTLLSKQIVPFPLLFNWLIAAIIVEFVIVVNYFICYEFVDLIFIPKIYFIQTIDQIE